MRKQRGNMYEFVTHTWNPIKGKCSHDCSYCYMKIFPLGPVRLVEKELRTRLDEAKFIFVGSSTDMFAKDVPSSWIRRVLNYCCEFPSVTYLFQSKNPNRFFEFRGFFPPRVVFGTTIETNRDMSNISKAPDVQQRAGAISSLGERGFETMVTIEPILDFDVKELIEIISTAKPTWVNIGADSKKHNLPEPTREKVEDLIEHLGKFTRIVKKNNLERLLN